MKTEIDKVRAVYGIKMRGDFFDKPKSVSFLI